MYTGSPEFALYLANKLGIDISLVSTKVLKKLANSKKQKEITGYTTITKGGRLLSLIEGKKKIDANTHGGKSQFVPITSSTDFIRIYLPMRPLRVPEFIVIDLDENDKRQLVELKKIIPEVNDTLITRTSTEHKGHVWFRYPQSTAATDYIVQSRDTKCSLIPGFSETDIFTSGVLFEGYLTTRTLKGAKREVPDFKYNFIQDKEVQVISQTSIARILSVLNQSKAKKRINNKGGYQAFSDSGLAATMRKYIVAHSVTKDRTKENTISESDVMYIYNTLFNPAIYVFDDAEHNPFTDNEVTSKSMSLFYSNSKTTVTRELGSLPRNPTSYNSLCMPQVTGAWEYYNNISLKVHSQDYLTFDEREAFIVKWLGQYVLPGELRPITIQGYLDVFWSEFGAGDIPYKEPITQMDISEKPDSLDSYLFGDYSMSDNYIYVPILIKHNSISKRKLCLINIETEHVKIDMDGDTVIYDVVDIEEKLFRTALHQKRREVQSDLTKNQVQSIKKEVDDWKGNIIRVATADIVKKFIFGMYDTIFYDTTIGSPVINTLIATPSLKIQKGEYTPPENVIHNIIYKQVAMSLASKEEMRTSTGSLLTLADGTPMTLALYYCMMLSYTLYNPKAPLGRFIMHGDGRTGKTRLADTIPRLLFPKDIIEVADKDNYVNAFTLDYSKIRVVVLNEIDYNSMKPNEKRKFNAMLKAVTEYGGTVKKELKFKDAGSQYVDTLTFETTNDIPSIEPEDTRVIVAKTSKSKDTELINKVHEEVGKLTQKSPETLEFAKFLRYLYDTNIDSNKPLHLSLTMNAPSTSYKKMLQIESVNNTERLHDMLLANGDLSPLEEYRDGSEYIDKRIDFLVGRTPIIYREDIDRIVIHMNDLRLMYWILSSKSEVETVDKEGAYIVGHEDFGDFNTSVTPAKLKHALKVTKLYHIDIPVEGRDTHILEYYDNITGHNEASKATVNRKTSKYVSIDVDPSLMYSIQNGAAPHIIKAEGI